MGVGKGGDFVNAGYFHIWLKQNKTKTVFQKISETIVF